MRPKFDLTNPCRDCISRSEICHVTCNAYKAWKIVAGREMERLRRENLGHREAWARQSEMVAHWNKQTKWRKR
jgi:hypothetical protein|nr:MAG TPA_asm: hypothetical protein [Caudoviricetes sp.]